MLKTPEINLKITRGKNLGGSEYMREYVDSDMLKIMNVDRSPGAALKSS